MNPVTEKILHYIRRNRVSSTEVADCLGKSGAIEGVSAVNQGMFAAGIVRYIYGHTESNWSIHEQARDIKPGEIVVMDGINVNGRALVGELVSKFILLYQEAAAIVALGRMRDANDLIKNRFAVWCQGYSPVGCFNRNVPESDEVRRIVAERKAYYDGALAVCDDTGVVIVPKDHLTEEFYQKLEAIEAQEDVWFNCIDFRKWDTFDTVCLKKYKEGDGV
jgi:regulator of RNase E activity RraA